MRTNLNRTDTLDSGDLIVLQKTNQGDFRAISVTDFISSIADKLPQNGFTTQYFNPTSGATSNVNQNAGSVHLLMIPSESGLNFSIVLPLSANLLDGQELMVTSTVLTGTITWVSNGATLNGFPTTISANGFITFKYDKVLNSWFRVG